MRSVPGRVTKRRPWWSEGCATALAVALLLATVESGWAAAPKGKPAKPARVAMAKHPAKPRPRHLPAEELGTAEVLPDETLGIHGKASFYAPGFHGRSTATGERFDTRAFTGASNHFPLGSWVAVRRLDTDRCVAVHINDRMHARQTRRVIDLSRAAAEELRMISAGVVLVRIVPIRGPFARGDKVPAGACREAFQLPPCPTCGGPQSSADDPPRLSDASDYSDLRWPR